MSSERSAPVLDLALGASPALSLAISVAGLLSLASILASGWTPWLKGVAVFVVAFAGAWWIYLEGLRRAPMSVVRLVFLDEHESMIVERSGMQRSVRVIHGTVVTASLAVVTLRTGRWRTRTVCLAHDAVNAESFRRLRMRLNVLPPAVKRTEPDRSGEEGTPETKKIPSRTRVN